MKLKEFIIILIALLIVFAAITMVKKHGKPGSENSLVAATNSDSIQKFWNYYNQATQYRLQGNTDSSVISYIKANSLNPTHKDALYYLGIEYMKANNFEKAGEAWSKLISLNPQSERAYNQLGNLYFCMNHKEYFNPEKAKEFFEKANELNKESLNPDIHLAEVALFLDKNDEAFTRFNKLSIMDQKNLEISFLNGYLYWKSGKERGAISNLEHAFILNKTAAPKNGSIDENLDCDLFTYWLKGNLNEYGKYDIRVAVPLVYKKFDQYLMRKRQELKQG